MPKQRPMNQHRAEPEANDVGYEVGYGKPPKNTQFKRGYSGNKSGRPKDDQNPAKVFEEELNKPVYVIENGQRQKITKLQAMLKQVTNKAASGDMKAMQMVIAFRREFGNTTMLDNLPREFTIDVFNQDDKPVEKPEPFED